MTTNRRLKNPRVGALHLPDSIANDIEQRILEGSLKPGDQLPAERDLASQMGVSRTSIRGALQKLVTRGLLTSRQGEGTFVTDQLDANFSGPWEEMLKKHPLVREDLLEFRELLESSAAACAAQRATEADRQRLRVRFGKLDAAMLANKDLDALVDLDLGFHQAIAEASHNVITAHLTASLLRLLRDHIRFNLGELLTKPNARAALRQQHRRIWEAIDSQNGTSAGNAAAAHMSYVRENLVEAMRQEARKESAMRRIGDASFGTAKE